MQRHIQSPHPKNIKNDNDSMNVLMIFSVNFSHRNEIFDIFDLPIEWAFQKPYELNF